MLLTPISIGLSLVASSLKDVIQSETGKSAISGIIGNRADHYWIKGVERIKGILDIRDRKLPENHDLLKILRRSMLEATDMLRQAMKEAGEEKPFCRILNKWIIDQLSSLSDISSWADWETPAAGQLEFFFKSDAREEQLADEMTASWTEYLATQLNTDLPDSFLQKLNSGWYKGGRLLVWSEVTMVLTVEAFRDSKNETNARAAKAFEQTFLSDLKIQLADIHQQLISQFPNAELITELSRTVSSQQETIASQQHTIGDLADGRNLYIKGNLSSVRRELTALAFRYDNCMETAQNLINVDREVANNAFMESATVLNQMIGLYESSKINFSTRSQSELDGILITVRTTEELTALITFVQRFDQILNSELAAS